MEETFYKPIIRKRFARNFLGFNKKSFSKKYRDRAIKGLVKKIEKQEKSREFFIDYKKEYPAYEQKSYVFYASIKSKDNVIKGEIGYIERGEYLGIDEDCISVEIKFNPKSEDDRPSYNNLIKILESENFDFEF